MFLDEFASYIRDSGLVPEEYQVAVGYLDASVPKGVLVVSPINGFKTTPSTGTYARGELQIIVRDNDPIAGDELAMLLAQELSVADTDIGEYRIKSIFPCHLPIMYPRNDAGLWEHSVNFDCALIRL